MHRLPEEITLDELPPPPPASPRPQGRWLVGLVLALGLAFLAFLVAWLG